VSPVLIQDVMGKRETNKDESSGVSPSSAIAPKKRVRGVQGAKVVAVSGAASVGRTERVVNLALVLLKEMPPKQVGRARTEDVSDSAWNAAFLGAMKRADTILRMVEERDYDIHAYQIFEEGLQYSAEAVSNRFKAVSWDDFSRNTLEKFFGELREAIRDYANLQFGRIPEARNLGSSMAYDAILEAVNPLLENNDITAAFPSFSEEVTRLLERLAHRDQGLSHQEVLELTFRCHSFAEWCFPVEERGEKTVQKYRAYEILRFAQMRGWHQERLTKTVADLADDFVPNPPRDPKDSFRMFDAGSGLPF